VRADLARVKQLRELRGLSQAQVAKRLGYKSSAAFSRLEGGRRKLRLEHLSPLAEILGVQVSEILDTETGKCQGSGS
jgi:transcriptional regulator with XRE-family HTH domain